MLPLLLTVSSPASANDEHSGRDHNQIDGLRGDVHLDLDRYGVLGAGGRIEFALVPNGLIGGNVRDELALSLGADLFFAPVFRSSDPYYPNGSWLVPLAVVQWNFYLGPDWSIFPEVGLAARAHLSREGWTDSHGREYGWLYPVLEAGFGARYHFNPDLALLMRASSPSGLQVGLIF